MVAVNRIKTSDLGPAVLPEFADVSGLDALAQDSKPSARGSAVPRVQAGVVQPSAPPVLGKDVWQNTIKQLDMTVSVMMNVPTSGHEGGVPDDYLNQVADGIYPLAAHYANQEATVTTLWTVAALSLFGYVAVKTQQYRNVQKAKENHGKEKR